MWCLVKLGPRGPPSLPGPSRPVRSGPWGLGISHSYLLVPQLSPCFHPSQRSGSYCVPPLVVVTFFKTKELTFIKSGSHRCYFCRKQGASNCHEHPCKITRSLLRANIRDTPQYSPSVLHFSQSGGGGNHCNIPDWFCRGRLFPFAWIRSTAVSLAQ